MKINSDSYNQMTIADHGVIGDLETMALVALDGTVDFLCAPHCSSPPVFAALLDKEVGGFMSTSPSTPDRVCRQLYEPHTNILVTRFFTDHGISELIDFMPVSQDEQQQILVRRIKVTSGEVSLDFQCQPRLGYQKKVINISQSESGYAFKSDDGMECFLSKIPGCQILEGTVSGSFSLKAGQSLDIILVLNAAELSVDFSADKAYHDTLNFWRSWTAKSLYHGRWQEEVERSALLLKLLTSEKYGSVAAAPTFALPEVVGGVRNWDYRYSWIRDASFSTYAFIRLGYVEEANKFMNWIKDRAAKCEFDGTLQVVYNIDGSDCPEEEKLDDFTGYGKSLPVRIGNTASTQIQLDIYGELMDSVYLVNKYGEPISHDDWDNIKLTVSFVEKNWRTPDHGIWEIQGEKRQYLHSRLMCWVTIDRAIRLARKRSLPAPEAAWNILRNDLHQSIYDDFWSPAQNCFVRAKGDSHLDGAQLLMPLVKFIGFNDPKWLSTLQAIEKELLEDVLIRRYKTDDNLPGKEGAFTACSFWYVECLARMGRLQEAESKLERLLSLGNHLHLFSEELSDRGVQLGNFPQALSHLALISTTFAIDREQSKKSPAPWNK